MSIKLETIEPFLLIALRSAAAETDDDVERAFARLGDRLNDAVEGTETQLDDFAKGRLVKGLKALTAELEVDGVDGPVGGDAPSESATA